MLHNQHNHNGSAFGRPCFFLDAEGDIASSGSGGESTEASDSDSGQGNNSSDGSQAGEPTIADLEAKLAKSQEIKASIVAQRDQLKARIRELEAGQSGDKSKKPNSQNTSDDDDGNLKELVDQLRAKNEELTEAVNTFRQQDLRYRKDSEIEEAAGGKAYNLVQLKKILASNVAEKEIEVDGEKRRALVAVHDDGRIRYTADGPMTVKQLVEETFSQNQNLLASQYRGGTDTKRGQTSTVQSEPQNIQHFSRMTDSEQNAWLNSSKENREKASRWLAQYNAAKSGSG